MSSPLAASFEEVGRGSTSGCGKIVLGVLALHEKLDEVAFLQLQVVA